MTLKATQGYRNCRYSSKNDCTAKPLILKQTAEKDQWPPNSLGLSYVWCNVGGLSQSSNKAEEIAELKEALQLIWDNLPEGPIDQAVTFIKRLNACVEAGGGHFVYLKWLFTIS